MKSYYNVYSTISYYVKVLVTDMESIRPSICTQGKGHEQYDF